MYSQKREREREREQSETQRKAQEKKKRTVSREQRQRRSMSQLFFSVIQEIAEETEKEARGQKGADGESEREKNKKTMQFL